MAVSMEPNRANPSAASPGARNLTVAAVDPVPVFRDGLAALVQRTPGLNWVGHAANNNAAVQMCEQLRPDIVVVDSGLDPKAHLTRFLTSGDPTLAVVVLVRQAHRNPQYLAGAIAVGVHAMVPRDIEPRRLVEAVRRAQLERRYLDPSLAALTARPKRDAPQARGENPAGTQSAQAEMPLSKREYQVLQLVAEGLENSAIAKVLYLSVETVRTHVKSILRKLSARDRTHAVTLAFRSRILVLPTDDTVVPAAQTRKGARAVVGAQIPAEPHAL